MLDGRCCYIKQSLKPEAVLSATATATPTQLPSFLQVPYKIFLVLQSPNFDLRLFGS